MGGAVGVLCGLDLADPELEDLGLLRLRGASGSEGGGGGDGVGCGGGDRFSCGGAVRFCIWGRCPCAESQFVTW